MNPIECKANELSEHIEGDLDDSIHEGFTVGKRGKVMYWYFIWHGNSTGNASIYTSDYPMRRSYIKGDQLIIVHFKNRLP